MSDPRYTDPRLSDPVLRHQEEIGGPYSWVAGIAVLLLIGFLIIAGLSGNNETANNNSPATTGTATRQMNPPTTTGSGATSPKPLLPQPAMPAPSKSGTQ